MTRVLVLVLTVLLSIPALAAEPDLSPRPGSSVDPALDSLGKGKEALSPRVAEPKPGKPGLGEKGVEIRPQTLPEAQRQPLEGVTGPDAGRRVTRPPSLAPEAPGAAGVRSALANLLRVDGRTGQVDLRGSDPAVARVEWQLDGPSDLAVVLVRRNGGGCPAAGTSLDALHRQLRSDPSVLDYGGWSPSRGSNQTAFGGDRYRGVTEVHVQACGIRGQALNGGASNVVRVLVGSVHRTLRLTPVRWSVEWSHQTESNTACGVAVDRAANVGPRSTSVGYASRVTRGEGPVPCVRDRLIEAQPSANFDVSGLPRDATILSAELHFTETDPERRSPSGRTCPAATRSVGMATGVVRGGDHVVDEVSRAADEARSLTSGIGSRRRVDVADWVRAWQRGRDSGVTFLGVQGRHGDAACLAQLGDVRIEVEFE